MKQLLTHFIIICTLVLSGCKSSTSDPSSSPIRNKETTSNPINTPDVIITPDNSEVTPVTTIPTVSQIAVGSFNNTCAVYNTGNVSCWGGNGSFGDLGSATIHTSTTPIKVVGVGGIDFLVDIIGIASGNQTCAISKVGNVYCWGMNINGELGNQSKVVSPIPVRVHGVGGVGFLTGIIQVSIGTSGVGAAGTLCGVSSTGNVYCWGYGLRGELGNNGIVSSTTPVQVVGPNGNDYLSNISQVTVGSGGTVCALSNTGNVYCWGIGLNGQMGNGIPKNSPVPILVKGVGGVGYLSAISQVYVGSLGVCAISSAMGNNYCWGGITNTSSYYLPAISKTSIPL